MPVRPPMSTLKDVSHVTMVFDSQSSQITVTKGISEIWIMLNTVFEGKSLNRLKKNSFYRP